MALSVRGLSRSSRHRLRIVVQDYFYWLYGRELILKHPKYLFPRMKRRTRLNVVLPEIGKQFLATMEPQLKIDTLRCYQLALRFFYSFLDQSGLSPEIVGVLEFENFLIHLNSRKLTAQTRVMVIRNVRVFLRWLFQHGKTVNNPDEFIKPRHFPKLPSYLPRPLQPNLDQELQKRLITSKDLYHKGLLLMRWTGIRVGELLSLRVDCIKEDLKGNKFLKVELGKLRTERLVPIDPKTTDLIHEIQTLRNKSTSKCLEVLIADGNGHRTDKRQVVQLALEEITFDFKTEKPITTHQLRHSYATSMINAGMNIVSLKKILGHHSIKMTLRYSDVTQETVVKEYFKAMEQVHIEYNLPVNTQIGSGNTLHGILSDLILIIKKYTEDQKTEDKKFKLIVRRLNRIQEEIKQLI